MKLQFLALALLLTQGLELPLPGLWSFAASPAHASSPPNFRSDDRSSLWRKYFPENRRALYRNTRASDLLKYDQSLCDREVKKIEQWIDQYATAAARSDSARAEIIHADIQENLLRELGNAHPCFEPAAKAYLLESVRIGNYRHYMTDEFFYPVTGFSRLALTAALLNGGFIEGMTTSDRESFGGIWRQFEGSAPKILGGYDCSRSKIWVDLTLPPLNAGSIVVHELDHLTRDKYLTAEELSAFRYRDEMQWESIVLFDETIANIVSTEALQPLRQKLHFDALKWKPRPKIHDATYSELLARLPRSMLDRDYKMERPLQLREDLNLNSPDGPLQEILTREGSYWMNVSMDGFGHYPPLRIFHSTVYTRPEKRLKKSLFQLLSKAYFSEGARRSWKFLNRDNDDAWRSFFKLSAWEMRFANSDGFVQEAGEIDQTEFERNELASSLEGVDDLMKRMSAVSHYCVSFQNAVAQGELNEFIGTPVRGGQGGVKTGQGGVKTGRNAVRPSASGFHPCLSGVL